VAAKKKKRAAATKRCGHCQESLPASSFARNAGLADGLAAYCRACKREVDRSRRRGAAEPAAPARVQAPKAGNLAPERPKKGRPSTITQDVIDAVCRPLRAGHSRRVAARSARLNEDTLASWMMRGREAKDMNSPTRQLYDAVLEAEGVGLMGLEEKALAGAEIDHVQALRLLERRDPETWARREVKPAGDETQQMEVADVRKLLTDRLSRFLDLPAAPPPAPTGGADGGPTG
jgi:hypothetical protein